MQLNENKFVNDRDNHSQTTENKKPAAYRVYDDNHIEEKDLERSFVYPEDAEKVVREGQPMGGQNFGENNLTPSGDDKNNPSQSAGYSNAYFARTEPSEEHPEDTNFKSAQQDGAPDYEKAQPYSDITGEMPKPEKVERGNGENDRPHKSEPYYEGTDDDDGQQQTNIPGPIELPDQQKVGEPDAGNNDEEDHIET
jgi:hypothetical protein